MKDIAMTVLGLGGKVTDARAVTLDGTFSATTTVTLPDDSCNLAWALHTKMPDYLTVIRPHMTFGEAGSVFGRIEVVGAKSPGAIAQFSEHMSSRGISFATFRVSSGSEDASGGVNFNSTATLFSTKEINIEWLENEFAELAEKLDVQIDFTKAI